ncbi:hypothetical protein B0H12DRAFT_1109306 [Mycena haematopus]|nr:hypothetical protein B0H12DRAFT_1109306 [Mycena haematopus]
MNGILLVVLAAFLFLMIPFTICIIFLLVQPKAAFSPGFFLCQGDPRIRSGYRQPIQATPAGGTMNNFPTAFHMNAYLQFPPAALQLIGRSLSDSRVPGDPEAGIRIEQLYIGIGHMNMPPTHTGTGTIS